MLLLTVLVNGTLWSAQAAPSACVAGPHGGTISASEEWCLADGLHQLSGDVTVAAGVTLTIEPGVIVMGSSGTEIRVQGVLQALGTESQPITFTSAADSGPFQWSGLLFDGGSGHLRHSTVRYSGAIL